MTTRAYLTAIGATWVVAAALWAALSMLPDLTCMILWLVVFACYLGLVLLELVSIDHHERSQVPTDPRGDEPPYPVPHHPPLRLVGISERRRGIRIPPEDIQ